MLLVGARYPSLPGSSPNSPAHHVEFRSEGARLVADSVLYKCTMLIDMIRTWQRRALAIAPPEGTGISPAQGGLPGPAFFPEGLGLQNPAANAHLPTIMAIGNNLGCQDYRASIDAAGREDTDNATWRNLAKLLRDAGSTIDSSFTTNWFIGLQPGDKQLGKFLLKPDRRDEDECRALLLDEIAGIKPLAIVLLGLDVVARAHEIIPDLRQWAGARTWRDVDRSSIGPVPIGVEAVDGAVKTSVVALAHPATLPSNQRHRLLPHAEMVIRALNDRAWASPE